MIVTAGNPVEYNRNAKEFDVVIWDRLKRIDVEPDFDAWRSYSYGTGIHASVITYLEAKRDSFFRIEETALGKRFVTARDWTDLSRIISIYEDLGLTVDQALIEQYLQYPETAEEFASYYDLFNKYKSDYKIHDILAGKEDAAIAERAAKAPFDERLSLLGLLLDNANADITEVMKTEDYVTELLKLLKQVKEGADIREVTAAEEEMYQRFRRMGVLSADARLKYETVLEFMRAHEHVTDFAEIKSYYDTLVADMKAKASDARVKLDKLFDFAEKVWGQGQEMVILVTELTLGPYSSRFIARYGCDAYYKNNESLKLYERKLEILKKGEELWQQNMM